MLVMISVRRCLWLGLAAAILTRCSPAAHGQESRYFEEGGITFRETRTKIQQPVQELEYKDEQQTYYRERYITDMQPSAQTVYQPAVQYVWEPRWHGWWRIFEGPHVAYHLVPRSTWQPQVVNYQVPVTRREVIPETRTVRVAVPKLSMKEVENVTRVAVGPAAGRVAVPPPPGATAPSMAWNLPPAPVAAQSLPGAPVYIPASPAYAYTPYGVSPPYSPYGGVARLYSDPPRYGAGVAGSGQGTWQARSTSNSTR
jgi:hypothetical protein